VHGQVLLRSEEKQGMIAAMGDFRRLLSRIRFVLVAPSHPGNVGASARALQAMGFEQLWLADPEDPKIAMRSDAVALSSGAAKVLGGATVCSLAQALGPVRWSCALSARTRDFEPPRLSLEAASQTLIEFLHDMPQEQGAFVFGAERSGLTNEQLLMCQRVSSLDVEEKFSSLNLSQAVQVVAYATRRALREFNQTHQASQTNQTHQGDQGNQPNLIHQPAGNNRETARPADHQAVDQLHAHLLRVAIRVGYLNPESPGRFDERLRRLLARKTMWEDEVQMLRGLCTEIERRT
jgi:tRNA/rRNA methyltransferase